MDSSDREFQTTMSAEIRVPQDGFTLEDLKQHMRKVKVPLDARLTPHIVQELTDPQEGGWERAEVRFRAEWLV